MLNKPFSIMVQLLEAVFAIEPVVWLGFTEKSLLRPVPSMKRTFFFQTPSFPWPNSWKIILS